MSEVHQLSPTQPTRHRARRDLGVLAARHLRDAEQQADESIAAKLALAQLLVTRRSGAGFAAAVGQEALAELARGIVLSVEARGALVKAHEGLRQAADEFGVPWRLEGPLEDKPIGDGGVVAAGEKVA